VIAELSGHSFYLDLLQPVCIKDEARYLRSRQSDPIGNASVLCVRDHQLLADSEREEERRSSNKVEQQQIHGRQLLLFRPDRLLLVDRNV
jgi:hypothetical protein